ncbi:hypothetical protein SDIAM103S_00404 [Streptomyces diastaticus subsp. diastaticus]
MPGPRPASPGPPDHPGGPRAPAESPSSRSRSTPDRTRPHSRSPRSAPRKTCRRSFLAPVPYAGAPSLVSRPRRSWWYAGARSATVGRVRPGGPESRAVVARDSRTAGRGVAVPRSFRRVRADSVTGVRPALSSPSPGCTRRRRRVHRSGRAGRRLKRSAEGAYAGVEPAGAEGASEQAGAESEARAAAVMPWSRARKKSVTRPVREVPPGGPLSGGRGVSPGGPRRASGRGTARGAGARPGSAGSARRRSRRTGCRPGR